MILEHAKLLLQPPSRTNVPSPLVQKDVLQSFARNDLLDPVGVTLFHLNPNAIEGSPAHGKNSLSLVKIDIPSSMFDKIGACHTPAALEESFRSYAPDWLKVHHQFVIRGICLDLQGDRNETAKTRKKHYEKCNGVWDSIARALRQKRNIDRERERGS
ncbi:hypothetical protein B0J17DRAFT_722906 [Rhizoctonia solani]|nr:hypothetical protein B0J17DRAFT_722906 [Rhizoctonia solani]